MRRPSFLIVLLAACDMPGATVLDRPELLALRATPEVLADAAPTSVTLEALAFDVTAPLAWRACSEAWRATDPVSCDATLVELGVGNPLTVELPAAETWWVAAAPTDDSAVPAVKRLAPAGDPPAANPTIEGLEIAADRITPRFDALTTPSEVVVTWYVTRGELTPRRTVGTDVVTLTIDDAQPVRVFGVARQVGGGVGWIDQPVVVTP